MNKQRIDVLSKEQSNKSLGVELVILISEISKFLNNGSALLIGDFNIEIRLESQLEFLRTNMSFFN